MICRRKGDGWLLISQPAHAWLAGKLAAAWGNEAFGRPDPWEAVILATRLHDIGWMAWDAKPRLNEQGQPVNFLDTSLDETIPLWQRAVEQVGLMDPYAALLVSKHASTIYQRRLEREVDPPEQRTEVEVMLAYQEGVQKAIRERLADHTLYGPAVETRRLHAAYRWLRVCDLLSLALCADFMPAAGEIQDVPGVGWAESTTIVYRRPEAFKLILDPAPFGRLPIRLSVQTRYLEEPSYQRERVFQAALKQAPWVSQTITVLAG